MRVLEFSVPPELDGILVKTFLRRHCEVSARLLAKLKHIPLGISREGQQIRAIDRLHMGDVVALTLPEDKICLKSSGEELRIIYEDEDVLVIDKNSGMPVHPSPGHDCDTVLNAFATYCEMKGTPMSFRPAYRLDKDTTGVLVIAKNGYTAARLSQAIQKEYFAVCGGYLEGEGEIRFPIRHREGFGIQRECGEGGVSAITHWKVLGHGDECTMLSLWLETGRTHQIRVHLAGIGHPLLGDDMYGGRTDRIQRQALHCGKVSFFCPAAGKKLYLESPLPEDMKKIWLDV